MRFLVFIGLLCNTMFVYAQKTSHPALIPFPQQMKWIGGNVDLQQFTVVHFQDSSFYQEAQLLKLLFADNHLRLELKSGATKMHQGVSFIKDSTLSEEAYRLDVQLNHIKIIASTSHGIFNAIQTMRQLIEHRKIALCSIEDHPAFGIRGYMFDEGRNYLSMDMLKQQIDVMSRYKMNVFHFHPTENIAWRIESKIYPELTASSNMIRNAGKFYNFDEIRDLKKYCEDRHILFIPEIDMPGHSQAFTRAMGFDMQSPQGKKILFDVLDEFINAIQPSYFHIGGDEVTYKDTNFLFDVYAHLKKYNMKMIGWNPGGKLPEGVYHQLWNGNKKATDDAYYIDSRHLYLNHLDPLEGVSTVFNHIILDTIAGSDKKAGAILCNWPDRKLGDEMDAVKTSPVYPVMLAFAERTWKGGGYINYTSDIGYPGEKKFEDFVSFENRMLRHKVKYFSNIPFPYVQQSHISWTLIGPYDNRGNTDTAFTPESKIFFDTAQLKNYQIVYGGTIWLKHFWHPMIGSHLKNPEDSTTWYAYRKVFSEKECDKKAWVGFYNISRSNPTATPAISKWDKRNSKVWVNGKEIAPPHWKYPGRIPLNDEEPLVDEGYEYRALTIIHLKKGWNEILIKAPVSDFNSSWQYQSKWMFTFVMFD